MSLSHLKKKTCIKVVYSLFSEIEIHLKEHAKLIKPKLQTLDHIPGESK